MVVVVGLAMVVSHQLTPVALVASLAVLALCGRLTQRGLPLLFGVAVAVYVSFLAADYWTGHFAELIGVSGGDALAQNVGDRLSGDPTRLRVVGVRLALTGLIWLLALAGAARALSRRALPPPLVVLALAPLPIPFVQPYGGEALLRAFLYTLPFMALLLATLVLAGPARWWTWLLAGVLVAVLGTAFLVARYGNERFERMRPGEVAAMEHLYRTAPAGSTFVVAIENLPWQYRDFARFSYAALDGRPDARAVDAALRDAGGPAAYFILTTGQREYGTINLGWERGWADRLAARLGTTAGLRLVLANPDALVYQRVAPSRAAPP